MLAPSDTGVTRNMAVMLVSLVGTWLCTGLKTLLLVDRWSKSIHPAVICRASTISRLAVTLWAQGYMAKVEGMGLCVTGTAAAREGKSLYLRLTDIFR